MRRSDLANMFFLAFYLETLIAGNDTCFFNSMSTSCAVGFCAHMLKRSLKLRMSLKPCKYFYRHVGNQNRGGLGTCLKDDINVFFNPPRLVLRSSKLHIQKGLTGSQHAFWANGMWICLQRSFISTRRCS